VCLYVSVNVCLCVCVCVCSLNLKTVQQQQVHLQSVSPLLVLRLSALLVLASTLAELCRGCQNLIAKLVTGELTMMAK